MKKIQFTKMHGLGNDFMVIDTFEKHLDLKAEQIQRWSHRKTGIGFDQLLMLEPCDNDKHVANYRIFNADGSEVEQCGNGARCIAKYLVDRAHAKSGSFTVETMTRVLEIQFDSDDAITVDMGEPSYTEEATLAFRGESMPFVPVSLGNPHAIFYVSTTDDVQHLTEISKLLQKDKRYPDGVNVSFAKMVSNDEIKVKTYERGVGVTEACGSGACAAVVAGILSRDLNAKVKAHLGLGDITAQWSQGKSLLMTGPAREVYSGVIEVA